MLKQDFTGKMFRKAKQNVPEHKLSIIYLIRGFFIINFVVCK